MAEDLLPEHENREEHIRFVKPDQPLTIEIVPMSLKVFQVSEDALDRLQAGSASLNWLFFGICFGALASFSSVLLSTPIQNAKTFATFVALTVLFLLGSAVFGVNGWRDYRDIRVRVAEIKAGKTR